MPISYWLTSGLLKKYFFPTLHNYEISYFKKGIHAKEIISIPNFFYIMPISY